MTPMERLFLDIFDRKNRIADQFREQAQSFAESVALNLVTDGGFPPESLWVPGSDFLGPLPAQEFCREQLVSGFLNAHPCIGASSISCRDSYSLPGPKADHAIQPRILSGGHEPVNCFFLDKEAKDELVGCPIGTMHQGMAVEAEVFDADPKPAEMVGSEARASNPNCAIHAKAKRKDSHVIDIDTTVYSGGITRARISSLNLNSVIESSMRVSTTGFSTDLLDKSDPAPQQQLNHMIAPLKSTEPIDQAGAAHAKKESGHQTIILAQNSSSSCLANDATETIKQQPCQSGPITAKDISCPKIISTFASTSRVPTRTEPRHLFFHDAECSFLDRNFDDSSEGPLPFTNIKTASNSSKSVRLSCDLSVPRSANRPDCAAMDAEAYQYLQIADAIDEDKGDSELSNDIKDINDSELPEKWVERCSHATSIGNGNLNSSKKLSCTCEDASRCTVSMENDLINSVLDSSVPSCTVQNTKDKIVSRIKDKSINSPMQKANDCNSGAGSVKNTEIWIDAGETETYSVKAMDRTTSQQKKSKVSMVHDSVSRTPYFLRSSITHNKDSASSTSNGFQIISLEKESMALDLPKKSYNHASHQFDNCSSDQTVVPINSSQCDLPAQNQTFFKCTLSQENNLDNVLPFSNANTVHSENQEVKFCASIPEVSMKSVPYKTTALRDTKSFSETMKGRYFLRSSAGKVDAVKSDKSSEVDYSHKLKKGGSYSLEKTWPVRSKMDLGINHSYSGMTLHPSMVTAENWFIRGPAFSFEPGLECNRSSTSSKVKAELAQLLTAARGSTTSICSQQNQTLQVPEQDISHTEDEEQDGEAESGVSILDLRENHISEITLGLPSFTDKSEVDTSACYGDFKGNMFDTNLSFAVNEDGPIRPSSPDKFLLDVSMQTMPELEGFSIGSSPVMECSLKDSEFSACTFDCTNIREGYSMSNMILTPVPQSSIKHKIHKVPDVYHSFPTGFEENCNFSSSLFFNSIGIKQHEAENNNKENDKLIGMIDVPSFQGTNSEFARSIGSLFDFNYRRALTPPLEKSNEYYRSAPERSGRSSGKGSNPELTCFRIDEDVSTAGEDDILDDENVDESISLSKKAGSSIRKALADVTSLYQNVSTMASSSGKCLERSSLDSVSTEAFFGLSSSDNQRHHSFVKSSQKNIKSHALLVSQKKAQGVKTRQTRAGKAVSTVNVKDLAKAQASREKGCKPSNIVTNMSSFIPMVREKQQAAAPANAKRDIKVKALQAAEAAKRLEEKKQAERNMRKEAAKLERMRLEKENIKHVELMRKQKEEDKRKKEVQIEARKRQREEEEKEKKTKRRCVGEQLRNRKEQRDKSHSQEELQSKNTNEHCGTGLAKNVKVQQSTRNKLECTEANVLMEVTESRTGGGNQVSNVLNGINQIGKEASTCNVQKDFNMSMIKKEDRVSQSYEISPYRDSDDEDGDEDNKRRRKFVPMWARWESLAKLIHSQRSVVASKIFKRKRFCTTDEVLSIHKRARLFAQ